MRKRLLGHGLAAAAAVCMLTGAPAALAWGVKSHYPMSVSPTMPGAEQAQRQVAEPPAVLRALRNAHRLSLQRGWKGVGMAEAYAGNADGEGPASPR